jgi:mannan endo-1,4-beta-mannosidase
MLALICFVAGAAGCAPSPPRVIHLEAEDARLYGPRVATARSGYSGTGYVTGFTKDGDRIAWTFQARAGVYEARIRYSSPRMPKGYVLVVNGAKVSAMFDPTDDGFATASAGKVELKEGSNAASIEKGWSWYDVDYLELTPASATRPLRKPLAKLVDPDASSPARALYASLLARYGKQTLTGQYGREDCLYILRETGKTPAIIGGDFMDYSPSRIERGADPKNTTEEMIEAAKAGQIVTMSWHWNAPTDLIDREYKDANGNDFNALWYKGFYSNATTFDVEKALAHPDSEDYRLLLRDIDAIALQLHKFAAAGVPVLWRPLHEAEGGWFWWGAKGPKAYIALWRLMFQRLTKTHDLHNLIWVHNCANPEWYPGDPYVDVVAVDAYPEDRADPQSSTWDSLAKWLDGKKPLAIAEFGGVPDVAKMHRLGIPWLYFVSWAGTEHGQSRESLRAAYTCPQAVSAPR